MGAPKKPRKPRRKKVDKATKGLDSAGVATAGPDGTALAELVKQDGGAPLAIYRDPLGGHSVVLAALPIEKVEPTPYQRDRSEPAAAHRSSPWVAAQPPVVRRGRPRRRRRRRRHPRQRQRPRQRSRPSEVAHGVSSVTSPGPPGAPAASQRIFRHLLRSPRSAQGSGRRPGPHPPSSAPLPRRRRTA